MHCDVCCSLLAISTKLSTTTTIMLQRQRRATIGICSVTSPQVQVHRPSTWVSYLQLMVCEYEQDGNIPAESTNRCYSVVRTCSKARTLSGPLWNLAFEFRTQVYPTTPLPLYAYLEQLCHIRARTDSYQRPVHPARLLTVIGVPHCVLGQGRTRPSLTSKRVRQLNRTSKQCLTLQRA
jgi:hypothetical protein